MIHQILFKPLPPIILKPILDCFFKSPLELEAAFFHLLATDISGDLELLYSGGTDAHRTANEFCAKGSGHYDCVGNVGC